MAARKVATVQLTQFVRRFESQIPAVAKDITEEIWAEIAGYRALDEDAKAEVEEAAARNALAFVRALREGHDLPKREIEALGKVGDRRAHQGISLEEVMRAFRTVGRVLWDHLSRELITSEAPMEASIELAGTLMRFTDQISSAVARHYSMAQRSIVRQQEAARREFLHDLLLGTYSSPDDMLERSMAFGYDLARPHLGVVAYHDCPKPDPAGDELAMSRALDRVTEGIGGGQGMVDRRGGQTIGLISLPPGTDLRPSEVPGVLLAELGEAWQVGLGGPHPGIEGCRRSYLEAREALEIGAILDRSRRSFLFEDFLLYRFLRSDHQLVERFVDAVIGALVEHDRRRRSELVKTLEAYFATDESAKEAGKRLYAHPHTVTYRLKQIERLTGRSLKEPEDKLHLHLAVKALRLIEGSVSEGRESSLRRASGEE